VWGGDALTEFGKPFWTCNLDDGLRKLKQAIHSHVITSHHAVPLIVGSGGRAALRRIESVSSQNC